MNEWQMLPEDERWRIINNMGMSKKRKTPRLSERRRRSL
jgi:hypothetical protein